MPLAVVARAHGIHADKVTGIGLPEPVPCSGLYQEVLYLFCVTEVPGIVRNTHVQCPVFIQKHAAFHVECGGCQFQRVGLHGVKLRMQISRKTTRKQQERG